VDHAHELYDAARDPKELWIVPGFGHAESACRPALVDRIGGWAATAAGARAAQERARVAAGAVAGNGSGPVDTTLLDLPPADDPDEAAAEEAAEAAGAAGPGPGRGWRRGRP
jgi:fermentation-respiration switch protein FrsA (DUF1100 family)